MKPSDICMEATEVGQELCEQLLELTFVSLLENYLQLHIHYHTICTPWNMCVYMYTCKCEI